MVKLKNWLLAFCLFLPGVIQSQNYNKTFVVNRPHFSYDVSVQTMAVLKEGLIVVSTVLEENNLNSDVLITRIDDNGGVVWSKRFGKTGRNEQASGVELFPGGGHVMVVGNSHEGTFTTATGAVVDDLDILLMKVSSADGTLAWSKRIGQARSVDQAWVVKRTQRNFLSPRFIILGSAGDFTSDDPRERPSAVRVDGNGNIEWSKRYPEVSVFDNTFDRPNQAIFNKAGELLIIGNYNDNFETAGLYTMGISTVDGHITADYKQLGVQNAIAYFGNIVKDGNGYLVAYGSFDTHLVRPLVPVTEGYITVTKMDSSRNLVWTRRYWKNGMPLQSGVSIHKSTIERDRYDILGRMLNANDAFPVLMSIAADGKVKSARKFEFENQTIYENYATNMVRNGRGYYLQAMSNIRGHLPRGFSIAKTDVISKYQCTSAIELLDTLAEASTGTRKRLELDFGRGLDKKLDELNLNALVLDCSVNNQTFEEAALSAYPNPVSSGDKEVRLDYKSGQAGSIRLDIRNNAGELLLSNRYEVREGENLLNIAADILSRGVNIATITDAEGQMHSVRILKQ